MNKMEKDGKSRGTGIEGVKLHKSRSRCSKENIGVKKRESSIVKNG